MSTFSSFIATLPNVSQEAQEKRAAFDFRTDTVTAPSKKMLDAMVQATLGDAVFEEDEVTTAFEAHVAKLLGHEAGVFVSSGTAGNQIALRVHLTQPPHSVLCDARSHIYTAESGGMASLSQALAQPVLPAGLLHMTLEDVKRVAVLEEDIHYAPTRVIAMENTMGGVRMPLDEAKRVSEFAKSHGIKMHLDGARLWNACAGTDLSPSDYGRVFDSVTMCFSKGLGAPVGSVLVGSAAFIKKAKWIRKSIGGGMRQTGTLAAAAWTALEDVYPQLPRTHAIAQDIAAHLVKLGLKVLVPVETNMVILDLASAGLRNSWLQEEGSKRGIKWGFSGRIVVHYQITSEAVAALKETVEAVLKKKAEGGYANEENAGPEEKYASLKK